MKYLKHRIAKKSLFLHNGPLPHPPRPPLIRPAANKKAFLYGFPNSSAPPPSKKNKKNNINYL